MASATWPASSCACASSLHTGASSHLDAHSEARVRSFSWSSSTCAVGQERQVVESWVSRRGVVC